MAAVKKPASVKFGLKKQIPWHKSFVEGDQLLCMPRKVSILFFFMRPMDCKNLYGQKEPANIICQFFYQIYSNS